jgi:recombinational DNA repair protein (RecF pathway)
VFLGQYDLFYTCELLYYARDRDGLHIARECTPLERRDALRGDWRAAMCASYLCDVVDHVAESSSHGGALYGLLGGALDALACDGAGMPLLLWFEARLLSVLGLSPDLVGCPRCLESDDEGLRFAVADGRVVCPHCGLGDRDSASLSVSRAGMLAIRMAARAEPPAPGLFAPFGVAALVGLRRFLGLFMRYHLDLPLESRGIAWGVLAGALADDAFRLPVAGVRP